MVETEADVREYVRKNSFGKARWVESGRGSTVGLPDCWLPMAGGWRVDLELKMGRLVGSRLLFKVRVEQRRELGAMQKDGMPCGLLIGIKGTDNFVFCLAGAGPVKGEVDLTSESDAALWVLKEGHSFKDFWEGVNFIFSAFAKNHFCPIWLKPRKRRAE